MSLKKLVVLFLKKKKKQGIKKLKKRLKIKEKGVEKG